MADYNEMFIDEVDALNKMAYTLVGGNAKKWAEMATNRNLINLKDSARVETLVDLRNAMGHGGSKYITVGKAEVDDVRRFKNIMNSTASSLKNNSQGAGTVRQPNNGGRTVKPKSNINLPRGTFRMGYIKEIRLDGNNGVNYFFRFNIVKEYQQRAYDDGTRFSGVGYTIYVEQAPYKRWCLENNRVFEFHYYALPYDRPSICWNELITDFSDANAVMITWAKRYVKIIVGLLQQKKINVNSIDNKVKRKINMPVGTFRVGAKQIKKQYNQKALRTITFSEAVFNEIKETLGTFKPENGGILGRNFGEETVSYFVFDADADTGYAEYSPNTEFLDGVLENEWSDVDFCGFIHSHPNGSNMLSEADIEYASRIIKTLGLTELIMPIVNSSYHDAFRITGYIVKRGGRVEPCKIKVVYADMPSDTGSKLSEEEIMKRFEQKIKPVVIEEYSPFDRIKGAIDLNYLRDCTVIGIGCGGAREFYLDMARIGVGNFILMDGDKVEIQNIACQHVYMDEIGMYKTEAIANALHKINPSANVVCISEMLEGEKDEKWFNHHVLNHCGKNTILLCAFTDNFFAQAKISSFAELYELPFISAQHHLRGETSEIIYWYPHITPFTQKDILYERYKAFYEDEYQNTVTSEGSPIFNTSRLNAICSKLALGMLLYGSNGENIYSSFLTLKPKSNLIIIRQNCLFNSDSNLKSLFTDDYGYLFDDPVWVDFDETEE